MFEVSSDIIDKNVLLERVEAVAKAHNIAKEFYNSENTNTTKVSLEKVQDMMIDIHQNFQMMEATWIIKENTLASIHPVIGKLIVFSKKAIRKLTRWLIAPLYQQQTNFNGAVTRTISNMINLQEMLIQLDRKSVM